MNHHHIYTRGDRKIPGIAILLFLLVLVGGMSFLFTRPRVADKNERVATNVKIDRLDVVNLRDRSATIFWETEKTTTGHVVYGNTPDNLTMTAYDELDPPGTSHPRVHHVVQLKGLQPNSEFFFKLNVDGAVIGQSEAVAYTSKTSRVLPSTSNLEPVYGDIVRMNGAPEKNAVVILTIAESKSLLTRTGKDGTFLFSLCCVLNSQNDEPFFPTDDEPVRIHVITEDGIEKTEEGLFADISPLQEAIIVDTSLAQLDNTPQDSSNPQVLAVSDAIERVKPCLLYTSRCV